MTLIDCAKKIFLIFRESCESADFNLIIIHFFGKVNLFGERKQDRCCFLKKWLNLSIPDCQEQNAVFPSGRKENRQRISSAEIKAL
jgi:hypothetical protein